MCYYGAYPKIKKESDKMNTLIPISYSYDSEADAIMIKIENYKHSETIELDENVLMDFNKKGEFIALEILSLSPTWKNTMAES